MISRGYVPLSVFSNYSFLEGASFPEELVARAAALDLPAMALTDRDGLYGMVRAHVAARELGLKLLVGATITRTDGVPLTLLATRKQGYAALSRLITAGRAGADKGSSRIDTPTLVRHVNRHLLLVHPALHLERFLPLLLEAFAHRFYAGISRTMAPGDEARVEAVKAGAARHRLPLVAAPAIHFHVPARKELADILSAIRHQQPISTLAGSARLANANVTFHHPAAFARLYQDLPGAVARTLEIADRCTFSLAELKYHYPREVVPAHETPMGHLTRLTWDHARRRYGGTIPPRVRRQLEHELRLIEELQYPNYFLTMFDIVSFARNQGILCQGRGSAANSAVCYVLGITAVDPARSNLLFERFISRERDEPPDIDVDFEHARREEVIQYIYRRYGRNRAAMVAEFIRYRTRSAIRDAGKTLGLSLPQLTRLSNLASSYKRDREDWWPQAVREVGFSPEHPRLQACHRTVLALQGFPRHLSIHVGGFIISDIPITHLVPVEPARMADRTVVQWDKEDVEDAGLLKIDVLALGMLTALRRSFDLLARHRDVPAKAGAPTSLAAVPAEDPATYRMIQAADTVGVFQIESRAQMSMLPRLKPTTFYDLVVEVAIVRPGPIQGKMVHPYLRRRQGLEPVSYPLAELEPVLGRTYGVPLFQEQVMKLAMVAGGFSGGEADQLRRAMGAWRRSSRLDGLLATLMHRMEKRGLSPTYARQIADQIRGFGEYGFPESHAASFALLAYASAYLKRHHPEVFCAALLNAQPMGFYAPATLIEDARRHHVPVAPISVNRSDWESTLEGPADSHGLLTLRLGLHLVRKLPEGAARALLAARTEHGPFRDFGHFTRTTHLDTHVLLKLALAGAFADLGLARREALWTVLNTCRQEGTLLYGSRQGRAPRNDDLSPWESVLADLDSTSVFLHQHPFALIHPHLRERPGYHTAEQLARVRSGSRVTIGGLAVIKQRPPTAGGVLFMTLEDHTGFHNLVIQRGTMQRYRRLLLEEPVLLVTGRLEASDGVRNILVEQVEGLHVAFDRRTIQTRSFR